MAHQPDVVIDDHDRGAEMPAHVPDRHAERFRLPRRVPRGRLVEQQHVGLQRDDARQLGHSPHPGRQLRRGPVGVLLEIEQLEHLGGAGDPGPLGSHGSGPPDHRRDEPRPVVSLQRDGDRFEDGEVGEQPGLLVGPAKAEPSPAEGRQAGHVSAVELDAAVLRSEVPGQDVEQRRLPGSVRTHQAEHLTGRGVHGDVVDGAQPAEVDADVLRSERGGRVSGRRGASVATTAPDAGSRPSRSEG